jgi:hypothetical protein
MIPQPPLIDLSTNPIPILLPNSLNINNGPMTPNSKSPLQAPQNPTPSQLQSNLILISNIHLLLPLSNPLIANYLLRKAGRTPRIRVDVASMPFLICDITL